MELNKTDFLEAGVQFGHYKNQWHPKMKQFVFSVRNRVHIMDFKQIMEHSISVCEQVKEIATRGDTIMFVGKKKQISESMKKAAINCDSPYLTKKWPGGFLTNFKTITREINNLHNLESLMSSESFKRFNKKEKIKVEKKATKLRNCYEGVANLRELPKFLFIMGLKSEITAVKEAKLLNIPIISICDTDTNPVIVDYLIPGNDDGIKSIAFFTNMISEAIKEGKNSHNKIVKVSPEEENENIN